MEKLKITICLILILLVPGLFGQNLVLNSSFEEYYRIPFHYTELDTFFCKDWSIPNESSPDFYHKDSKDPDFGVPKNSFGTYSALTGVGYIGICPLKWDGYMEHLTGRIKEPLIKGKKYKVGFHIRFAGNYCLFFASNVGIKFSQDLFPLDVGMPFYNEILTPTIKADVKFENFVKDTSWQLLQWDYIAKGNEKYITIGIFYESKWNMEKRKFEFLDAEKEEKKKIKFYNKNQDVLLINPNYELNNKFGDDLSYYFIDDVFVEPEIGSH